MGDLIIDQGVGTLAGMVMQLIGLRKPAFAHLGAVAATGDFSSFRQVSLLVVGSHTASGTRIGEVLRPLRALNPHIEIYLVGEGREPLARRLLFFRDCGIDWLFDLAVEADGALSQR